jgi:hypothetical protein
MGAGVVRVLFETPSQASRGGQICRTEFVGKIGVRPKATVRRRSSEGGSVGI